MAVSIAVSEFITRKELSQRLSVHPNTLARLEKKGVITGLHFGGSVRYRYDEILNDLKAREKLKSK